MSRLVPNLAIALATVVGAVPVLGADYGEGSYEMRQSYPDDWEMTDEGDPLGFEVGLRYWYSMGGQDAGFLDGAAVFASRDTAHILEGHFRIDDHSTGTYVKAFGGHSVLTGGTYITPTNADGTMNGTGKVFYAVGDFGWTPLNGDTFRAGFFGGYQYWNDSPDMGRGDFVTAVSATTGLPTAFDSAVDNLDIHALRLGITAHAEFNEMFDINAELAAIPYAQVSGVLGAHEFNTFDPGSDTVIMKSSETAVNGIGYGAAAEVLIGVHPTENMTLRFGGRAWYLGGTLDATFEAITATDHDNDPATAPIIGAQNFIATSNWASLFRYGALFEATFSF